MNKYTDQEFTYRETPVSYDGIAKASLKGNTVAWNQLVQNGNFASTSGWVEVRGTVSASSNELTYSITELSFNIGNRVQRGDVSIPNAHKVLLSAELNIPVATTCTLALVRDGGTIVSVGTGTSTANTYKKISVLATNTYTDIIGIAICFNTADVGLSVGSAIKIRNVQCFDLTQMGLEAEEFRSLYSLPYYSYNQGTLVNFNGNGLKAVGFNQWDEQWEEGDISSSTGQNQSATLWWRSTNYVPVIPNEQYYVYAEGMTAPRSIRIRLYGADKSFLGITIDGEYVVPGQVFTIPSDVHYIRFAPEKSNYPVGTKFCINISSSRNGEYEPYKETITDLPISTYFPTGMKSAGSVYDELTPNKASTRIGSYETTGTDQSSWQLVNHYGNYSRFDNNHMRAKVGTTNFISNSFSAVAIGTQAEGMNIHGGDGHLMIQILTSKLSSDDPAGLMSYFASHPFELNYELASPTEQDINADLYYKFFGNGTEEILPTNGSTPTTSAFFGDITYYSLFDGETPYRKFWLINGNGERWNFTEHELKTFLNNPNGLGFKKTLDLIRYGERAVKNSEVYDLPTVTGDLLFYDTANSSRYDRYNEFVRFLMDQPIKLYYQIPVSYSSQIADLYTLDCEVSELRKTESKPEGLLTSNITINGLSFYEGEEVVISGSSTTISIENKGDFAVGFEITIEGTMTNPYFTLEQDEELYGEGRFVDSTAFNSVYVNSNDGEQDLVLQQNGSILPNPLSYQDLSISNGAIYVTFVKLARGVSELKVMGGTISNVTIRFKPMFRSV